MGKQSFMARILDNISSLIKNSKKIVIITIIFLIIVLVYIYNANYYVVIRFNELGPVTKNMSVYYNGFKVGKIISIEPDKDFSHTLVKVNLTQTNLKLPQNTTVQMKNFPNGELYLEFIYPSSPSLIMMSKGDMLEGISPYSLEEFMLGQNVSGVTDLVSIHVIKALNAMQVANMEMENFFKMTTILMQENQKGVNTSVNNVSAMTKSLAEMAENLNQASKKINNSLDEKSLKDSTSNIKDSTSNIKTTTDNISEATKDIDKTMKKLDDTMTQVNAAAKNLNCMTSGLNKTLSKRGGGMRVMFGTPVKSKSK